MAEDERQRMQGEIDRRDEVITRQSAEIALLKQAVDALTRRIFGAKSESLDPGQLELLLDPDASKKAPAAAPALTRHIQQVATIFTEPSKIPPSAHDDPATTCSFSKAQHPQFTPMTIPYLLRPVVLFPVFLASIARAFDSDLDGLDDSVETATGTFVDANNTGTDPFLPDTDGDGLNDGEEVNSYHTSPLLSDSDSDGLTDAKEVELGVFRSFTAVVKRLTWEQARLDAIQSGGRLAILPNAQAYDQAVAQARSGGYTDYMWIGLRDTASNSWRWLDDTVLSYESRWGSGYPSFDNKDYGFVGTSGMNNAMFATPATTDLPAYMLEKSPLNPLSSDTDSDGLLDGAEVNTHKSNPTLADSDEDGLDDFVEVTVHQTNPTAADSDGDGLDDKREVTSTTTNPKDPDSDGDGASDGLEVNTMHSNPKDFDTDNDGYLDGFEYYAGYSASSAASKPAALLKAHHAIELEVITQLGKRYRLQSSSDLNAWNDTEVEVDGTGGSIRQIFRTGGSPERFWRFVEIP